MIKNKAGNNQQPPKAIIFDVTGVLFKEKKLRLIGKLGLWNIIVYVIKYRRNPFKRFFQLLDILHQQEDANAARINYKGHPMPSCIAAWQEGLITDQMLSEQMAQYVARLDAQGYFLSSQEKALFSTIMDVLLDPQELARISKPIKPMIKLINRLKKRGHKLFILSNMANETFDLLEDAYADFLELFDGIVISAHVQMLKPHKEIYEHLCDQYEIDPTTSIFIDDQADNIATAQELGITGIHYTKFRHVKRQLRKLELV